MARRHRGAFVRPQPRTKIWIGAGVGATNIGGSSKVLVSVLSAGALLLRPFTILRTHQLLSVFSDQATAIETIIGAYGRMVVTDTASGIGSTAVPDPSGISGDPEQDWFLWQAIGLQFFIDVNGTEGIGMDGDNGHQYVLDSKAMRKVGPNDDVISVARAEGAIGYTMITQGRMLIQLH